MPTHRLAQDGGKEFLSFPVSSPIWLSEDAKYGEMSKELFRYSKSALSNAAPVIYFSGALRKHI
jgi:hypothetical protein